MFEKFTILIKHTSLWICVLILLITMGCNRTKPQLPANREIKDTITLALIELNQRYVQQATTELAFYVSENHVNYTLDEMGFWYRIVEAGNGPVALEQPTLTLHRQLYSLGDSIQLYRDEVMQVRPAKKEIMDAIDLAFPYFHVGDSVSILAPWYMAFGSKGDGDDILPYTSLRVELRIMQE